MPRLTKSRSRKSRQSQIRERALSQEDRLLMRRYLAFVRAVVGAAKPATR